MTTVKHPHRQLLPPETHSSADGELSGQLAAIIIILMYKKLEPLQIMVINGV